MFREAHRKTFAMTLSCESYGISQHKYSLGYYGLLLLDFYIQIKIISTQVNIFILTIQCNEILQIT